MDNDLDANFLRAAKARAIVGLIVFLAVLPVVPFMPMCQQKLGDWEDMGIVFGWMIPEYRELLTEEFDNMGSITGKSVPSS